MASPGRWLCLGILLALCPAPANAQWPSEVAPGARVQVRLPEAEFQSGGRRGHLIRGRVARLAQDSLYLAVTDSVGPLAIPRGLIQRLDISRGVSRSTSAVIQGLRLGLVVALISGLANDDDSGHSFGEAALIGGGVGFAFGAVLGAVRPEERWRRVRVGVAVPGSF